MRKTPLISLFFLLALALSFLPNAQALDLYSWSDYPIYGVSNNNPAIINIKVGNETKSYYAYAHLLSWKSTTLNLTIWDIERAEIKQSLTYTISPAGSGSNWILIGIGLNTIWSSNGEPLDSFLISVLTAEAGGTDQYERIRVQVLMYNFSSNTLSSLGNCDRNVNMQVNSDQIYQFSGCYFTNLMYRQGYYIYAVLTIGRMNINYNYKTHLSIFMIAISSSDFSVQYTTGYINLGDAQYKQPYFGWIDSSDLNADFIFLVLAYGDKDGSSMTFRFARWELSTWTLTILSNNYGYNSWKTRYVAFGDGDYYSSDGVHNHLLKVKGIGKQVSGEQTTFFAYIPFTSTQDYKGYLRQVDVTVDLGYNFQSFDFSYNAYVVGSYCYPADLRNSYSAITDVYWYNPASTNIFSAGVGSDGTITTYSVNLGQQVDSNTYLTGVNTYFKIKTTTIEICLLASPIPTVYDVTPPQPTPSPEEPEYPSYMMGVVAGLCVPFLFMFLPAIMLGKEAGVVGLIVGLCLSITMLYMSGLLPLWAVFLSGLGIIALIFFGRNVILGGSSV